MIEIITTVLSAASTYDLTDLATVRDEMQLKAPDHTQDAWLGRAISQASAEIANYCNRVFPVETLQDIAYLGAGWRGFHRLHDRLRLGDVRPLQLSRWPLVRTTVTLPTAVETDSGNVLPFTSTTSIAVGQPAAGPNIKPGAIVTGVEADTNVTLSAPITGTVAAGANILFGAPSVTVADADGSAVALVQGTDFTVDYDKGWLIRLSPVSGYPIDWTHKTTAAVFQGGYNPIPPDLVGAILRVITGRNSARGRDPLLKIQDQPGLGSQTYWVGTVPGLQGAFSQDIAAVLDNYRAVLV